MMMEVKEVVKTKGEPVLPPSPALTVAVAIKGNKKSKYLVQWALEKFIPEAEGIIRFKLLHVCPRITSVRMPMRNFIPIEKARDDVVAAYKKEKEQQTRKMLLPFTNIFAQRKVTVDVKVINSDDIANAIAEEVANCTINKLVIGASSHGIFTRKVQKHKLSSRISVCTPNFCTVYAVSKGKLTSVRRQSHLETNGSVRDDSNDTSCSDISSSYSSISQTGSGSVVSYSHFRSSSLPMLPYQALSSINKNLLHKRKSSIDTTHSQCQSLDIEKGKDAMSTFFGSSEIGQKVRQISSYKSLLSDNSDLSDQASTSDMLSDCSSSEIQVNINFELEKLRIELRHARVMNAIAQSEAIHASRQLSNLSERRLEEATKLKEISLKEGEALESTRQDEEKYESAIRESNNVRECAEREALKRLKAERQAERDAKEKEKLENALVNPVLQYQELKWEEIVSGTSSFSENLKIGMGAYGTVYKCSLHHTIAAVKVLRSKENHQTKQFQKELEILSRIRHPHLLLLLGACPDQGCLVYEYMENGSLEDRLYRNNNTPAIPWFERYRIAWEVASALVFLHSSKPKQIIHRDLKPANILLDRNLVSKIGDVGLSTMLNSESDPSKMSTTYKDTGPVGTLCYIDPEYQRNGLVSPKSDVYAFGMIILQLLTAKPAITLVRVVETAVNEDRLSQILDSQAGNWPIKETKELAELGLSCTELRRRDRPDLKDQVLPVLERLKEVADRARDSVSSVRSTPPNHFICPILKDVMKDPCVAADGYTYDRRAIQEWIEKNDKSPMTNMALPNKNLSPNYSLMAAIVEWETKEH